MPRVVGVGASRPVLLLDVDGPLNPYMAKAHRRPAGYSTYRTKPRSWIAANPHRPAAFVRPLRVWLNVDHGARLLSLPYDLVWATTWKDEANEWIGPPLHLPELPWLDWPREHEVDPAGIHWKTRHIVDWADGRPFAWVDDELGPADRAFVAAHHPGPALLHWVDPRLGLRDDDFDTLARWPP
ncbi:hypothetical protein [Kutzneria sp. NPDC052558]|uniref:hypothetical protein n=1 Tax=Kutzneria sp. NPDC052558 TaxID=3364121 RepID=UPI0037C6EFA8